MQDNKPTSRRITVATLCGAMGAAFVGLTALQSECNWPQWAILFLSIGISLFIIALGILVPPQWWPWANIGNKKRRLHSTYLWIRYRPKYIIEKPVIESSLFNDHGPAEIQYKAKFGISIKNRALPIKVRLHEASVVIEQETEWGKNTLYLGNLPGQPEIEMKPGDKGHWDLVVSTARVGGNAKNSPDLQKTYQWGIQQIYITLPKSGPRELHKGIYHKPIKQRPIVI